MLIYYTQRKQHVPIITCSYSILAGNNMFPLQHVHILYLQETTCSHYSIDFHILYLQETCSHYSMFILYTCRKQHVPIIACSYSVLARNNIFSIFIMFILIFQGLYAWNSDMIYHTSESCFFLLLFMIKKNDKLTFEKMIFTSPFGFSEYHFFFSKVNKSTHLPHQKTVIG